MAQSGRTETAKNPTVVFDGLRKTGMPERYGFRKADFERAMNALFRDQKIKNVPYGRKGDERTKIALCSDSEGGKERQQPA